MRLTRPLAAHPAEFNPLDGPIRLIELSDRLAPPTPIVQAVELADGTRLRTARWLNEGADNNGTVLICTGRGEFIEKYFEVVSDLLRRGFSVVAFDWRGQGFSSRTLRDRRKGHVGSFNHFDDDLAAVVQRVLRPFCPKPHYALAHSMGGAIAIHRAFRDPTAFERIVLSAPMIAIHDLPFPRQVRQLVRALNRSGLGGSYMPRGDRAAVLEHGFRDNVLTSDPRRFRIMTALVRAEPRLAVGAPTIGWLHAAFVAMASFDEPDFCERVTTPMLLIVPGADRVISVAGMQRLGQRLRTCQTVLIPFARHEILMERDSLRDQFWAAFDAFLPERPASLILRRNEAATVPEPAPR